MTNGDASYSVFMWKAKQAPYAPPKSKDTTARFDWSDLNTAIAPTEPMPHSSRHSQQTVQRCKIVTQTACAPEIVTSVIVALVRRAAASAVAPEAPMLLPAPAGDKLFLKSDITCCCIDRGHIRVNVIVVTAILFASERASSVAPSCSISVSGSSGARTFEGRLA